MIRFLAIVPVLSATAAYSCETRAFPDDFCFIMQIQVEDFLSAQEGTDVEVDLLNVDGTKGIFQYQRDGDIIEAAIGTLGTPNQSEIDTLFLGEPLTVELQTLQSADHDLNAIFSHSHDRLKASMLPRQNDGVSLSGYGSVNFLSPAPYRASISMDYVHSANVRLLRDQIEGDEAVEFSGNWGIWRRTESEHWIDMQYEIETQESGIIVASLVRIKYVRGPAHLNPAGIPGETCDLARFHDPVGGCLQHSLLATNTGETETYGSAVWLGGRYVLTAGHIRGDNQWQDTMFFSGHDRRAIEGVETGENRNLAFVEDSGGLGHRYVQVFPERGGGRGGLILIQTAQDVFPFGSSSEAIPFLNPIYRNELTNVMLHGAGFGLAAGVDGSEGVRRHGVSTLACLPDFEGGQARCKGDMLHAEHQPTRQGVLNEACDLDSGSPLFAEVDVDGEQQLALIGILETSNDDDNPCAPVSHYIDLTRTEVQEEIRAAIVQLEGLAGNSIDASEAFELSDGLPKSRPITNEILAKAN